MTEEIKEILDYLKRSDKNKFGFEQGKFIDYEEVQLILDYITNLQQGNDRTNQYIDFYKELVDKQNKTLEDYKSRCEKAIEYIKLYSGEDNNFCLDYHELNPLLNILQGSDEE